VTDHETSYRPENLDTQVDSALYDLAGQPDLTTEDIILTIKKFELEGWTGYSDGKLQKSPDDLAQAIKNVRQEILEKFRQKRRPDKAKFYENFNEFFSDLDQRRLDPFELDELLDQSGLPDDIYLRTAVSNSISLEITQNELFGDADLYLELWNITREPISGYCIETIAQKIRSISPEDWAKIQNEYFSQEDVAILFTKSKKDFIDRLMMAGPFLTPAIVMETAIETIQSSDIPKGFIPILTEAMNVDLLRGAHPLSDTKEKIKVEASREPLQISQAELDDTLWIIGTYGVEKMQFEHGKGDFVDSLKKTLLFAEIYGLSEIKTAEQFKPTPIATIIDQLDHALLRAQETITPDDVFEQKGNLARDKIIRIVQDTKMPETANIAYAARRAIFNTLAHRYAGIDYSQNLKRR